MATQGNRPLAHKAIAFILAITGPTIFTFYFGLWLQNDVLLEYSHRDVVYSIGQTKTEYVTLDIDKIIYNKEQYPSLRIVDIDVRNTDSKSLSGLKFYFVTEDGTIIPKEATIDVKHLSTPTSKGILRIEEKYVDSIGPGFYVLSPFPGNSEISAALVLDVEKYPQLKDVGIKFAMEYNENGKLQEMLSGEGMLTIRMDYFILWLLISAIFYGGAWLIANIYSKNYSSGAKIVNWIIVKLGGKGFIRE